jgi:hypothetical protein
LIERELAVFASDAMKRVFRQASVTPYRVNEKWIYGMELHECWVVAGDSERQIVYCETGFGPQFPWSAQPKGSNDLGMDGQWCAYLFEAFVPSGIWQGEVPDDFMLMGPGERG